MSKRTKKNENELSEMDLAGSYDEAELHEPDPDDPDEDFEDYSDLGDRDLVTAFEDLKRRGR